MSVQIAGNAGTVMDVDEARNVQVYQGIPGYPAAGGFYSAGGSTAAVVAATLAANTMLMSARMSAGSTRKAYVVRMRVLISVATVGTSALVAGTLGLQRFTAQTPTGGTARTAARSGPTKGTASDITDIRDSNAALTGSAPTFGDVVAMSTVPVMTTGTSMDWTMEFPAPIELSAGDGLALRTQIVMPGTQTWMYSYNMYWFER
jgi:hypothetical protein